MPVSNFLRVFSRFENSCPQPLSMTLFDLESDFDCWFEAAVGRPTAIQRAAWPLLRKGRHALLVASTGQGKSLAAWRPLIERLVSTPAPGKGVRAVHIAPLKALARDMVSNLEPILEHAGRQRGAPMRIGLRCGDTTAIERAGQRRNPPEILSTTPESLFVLLGSAGGRRLLRTVEAIVVDEIHAIVGSKRGAHLALSLARLDRLARTRVQRIGLSATARPAGMLSKFLGGASRCAVVEPEHAARVELQIELPSTPLGAFPNLGHWQQIHERILELSAGPGEAAGNRGSLLVFCQTRAQVERTAAALDEALAEIGRPGEVGAHHGSLDATHREAIEARFKAGRLTILVSSASLELGLDLGHVDRVCQLGVPGSVNLVRQRAGRSGHRPGRRPCMHLFPLTLNQLVEAHALANALTAGEIDACEIPQAPADVLTQHLAAMIAAGEGDPAEMLAVARSAWQYRGLQPGRLEMLLALLERPADNMPAAQGRPLIAANRIDSSDGGRNHRWRALPGADRLVLTNAGVIPEFFEYDVIRGDTGAKVGTLDEEFAFESSPGQVVQLGRRAWRILRVRTGEVLVEPADEDPLHLPFWFGEGPGRTREMAEAMLKAVSGAGSDCLHPQAAAMLDESMRLLGALPADDRLVIERFADPGGDRHVVLHTFAGARINRAWGLALRKRFCRQFNFELQAAATDDGILISLGVTSEFDLPDVVGFVRAASVADVLTQALLDTPLFVTRFRWCANNAMVLLKNALDGRVPAQRQRSQTENLIACVFPDQLACLENLSGPRQVPDHPLVKQALADCLHDYMDLEGLKALLQRLEQGQMAVHAVETGRPSPLAEALIHAPRYSYLDEAAAEERRTRNFESHGRHIRTAVTARPSVHAGAGRVNPPAENCATSAAARHDASARDLERLLSVCGFLTASEGEAGAGMSRPIATGGWTRWFSQLVRERRALSVSAARGLPGVWVSIDRLGWILALNPELEAKPWLSPALIDPPSGTVEELLDELVAARMRIDAATTRDNVLRILGVEPCGRTESLPPATAGTG